MKFLAYMVLKLYYAQESNIKWPKIAKGHNSNKISFNWFKIPESKILQPRADVGLFNSGFKMSGQIQNF